MLKTNSPPQKGRITPTPIPIPMAPSLDLEDLDPFEGQSDSSLGLCAQCGNPIDADPSPFCALCGQNFCSLCAELHLCEP